MLIELTAHKEKLMREKIVLQDEADPSKTITLHLHARVLGEVLTLRSLSLSYQKKDGRAWQRDNDKDRKVCFLVTRVIWQYLQHRSL